MTSVSIDITRSNFFVVGYLLILYDSVMIISRQASGLPKQVFRFVPNELSYFSEYTIFVNRCEVKV